MDNFQNLATAYVSLDNELTTLRFWVEHMYDAIAVTVVLFIFVMGYIGYLINKRTDRETGELVAKHLSDFTTSMLEEFKRRNDGLDENLKKLEQKFQAEVDIKFKNSERKIVAQEAEAYRIHGKINDVQNSPSISYIWWLRAADKYSAVGEVELAKISLENALDALKKLEKSDIAADTELEARKLLQNIVGDEFKTTVEITTRELERVISGDKPVIK